MIDLMSTLWIICAAVIGVLHIVSPLLSAGPEKIISYIALFLHIPTTTFLLLAKEKIETVALFITLSLLAYIVANTLIPFIKSKVKKNGEINTDNRVEEDNSNDI